MDKNITYNSALEEIEKTFEEIENNVIDIDILAKKVTRVSELLAFCKNKLRTTEDEVEKVLRSIE